MVHFENGAWSIPILKTAMHFQYWAHQRKYDLNFDREVIYSIAWWGGRTEYWISGTYVVVDCRISYTPQSSINKHARITSPDFSFRPSFYGMAFGTDTLCFIPSKIREHKEIAMHFCIFRILPRVYFSKLRWFINYDQMVLLWDVMLRNWIQCLCLHFPTDQDVHRVVNWLWEDLGKRIRVAYRKRSEGTLFPGSKLYILHFMRISHTVKSKCHVWAKLGKLVIETQYSWTMSFKYVAWHSLAKLSYS